MKKLKDSQNRLLSPSLHTAHPHMPAAVRNWDNSNCDTVALQGFSAGDSDNGSAPGPAGGFFVLPEEEDEA